MVCGFTESCCLRSSHPSFSEAANGFILPGQTHFFWRPKGQSPETFDLAMSQKQALNRAEESFRHLSGIRLFSWVRQWHARPATLLIWWVVVDVCLCLIPYFQVTIAAVTFTFPLKTFLSSTIIQFVFFDEIDTWPWHQTVHSPSAVDLLRLGTVLCRTDIALGHWDNGIFSKTFALMHEMSAPIL